MHCARRPLAIAIGGGVTLQYFCCHIVNEIHYVAIAICNACTCVYYVNITMKVTTDFCCRIVDEIHYVLIAKLTLYMNTTYINIHTRIRTYIRVRARVYAYEVDIRRQQ